MSKEQQILLFGILSIVCCGLLGPWVWMDANQALRMIDTEGYSATERNLVVAGQTCAMIGTGILVVGVLIFFLRAGQSTIVPQ